MKRGWAASAKRAIGRPAGRPSTGTTRRGRARAQSRSPGARLRLLPQGPPLRRLRIRLVSCHLQTTSRPPGPTMRPPASRPAARRATSRRTRPGRRRRSAMRPSRSSACTRHRRAQLPQERRLKGTPRDCVGCHLADYQKTTSPNHAAAGFATACERATGRQTRTGRARVQSREHLPARRPARDAGVRELPQERRLQGHAARLRRLPPGRLPEHINPNHAAAGYRDDLRDVSSSDRYAVDGRRVQPREYLRARRPARHAGVRERAARTASSRARPATASAATWPITSDDRPNHAAPGSRRRARSAIGRPTPSLGAAAGSTTRAPSRSSACSDTTVRELPQERRLPGTPRDCVGCHLPDYQRTTSEPRGCRVPDDLRRVPQPEPAPPGRAPGSIAPPTFALVGLHATQPCAHAKERRLPGHAARLRGLPPGQPTRARPVRITRRRVPHRLRKRVTRRPTRRGIRGASHIRRSGLRRPPRGAQCATCRTTPDVSRHSPASPAATPVRPPIRTTADTPGTANTAACYSYPPNGRAAGRAPGRW